MIMRRFVPVLLAMLIAAEMAAAPPEIQNVSGFLTAVSPGPEELDTLLSDLSGSQTFGSALSGNSASQSPWYLAEYYFRQQKVVVLYSGERFDFQGQEAWRRSVGACPGRALYFADDGVRAYAGLGIDGGSLIISFRDAEGILCDFIDQFIPLLVYFRRELAGPGPHFPGVIGILPQ
jgi:hypothetical protein